jgi:hypothetical protein
MVLLQAHAIDMGEMLGVVIRKMGKRDGHEVKWMIWGSQWGGMFARRGEHSTSSQKLLRSPCCTSIAKSGQGKVSIKLEWNINKERWPGQ